MSETADAAIRLAALEAEVGRHQVVHQRLAAAKRLLDDELKRFRVIQQFVERVVMAESIGAFYEVTLESLVEAFEFEVALFLRNTGDPDCLAVVCCFGFDEELTGSALPFDAAWLKGADSRLFHGDDDVVQRWAATTNLAEVLLCPFFDKNGAISGVVIGGRTKDGLAYYDALSEESLSSFSVMVGQAGALLANQELADEIHAHNAELESLSKSYSRFVPFEFLKLLGRDTIQSVLPSDHVSLDMTVLYSDLRQFTKLSEALGAEKVFALLNAYLGAMEQPIKSSNGFINHYQGDAVTALFPGSADSALAAAIAMVEALATFNAAQTDPQHRLRMGIGINSGVLMLGAVGGGERLDSNVVGDTVNLTARTEGLTKLFGATCVVTDLTVKRLENPGKFDLRELDRVVVAGRNDPVVVYELLGCDVSAGREAKRASAETFAKALDCYRRGDFAVAIGVFAEVLGKNPDDAAAKLFVQRCAELVQRGPGADWTGVTVLDGK